MPQCLSCVRCLSSSSYSNLLFWYKGVGGYGLGKQLPIFVNSYGKVLKSMNKGLGRTHRSHLDFLSPNVADNSKQNQQRQRSIVVVDMMYALNHRGTPTWLPGTVSAMLGPCSLIIKFSNEHESRYQLDHVRGHEQDGKGGKEDEGVDDWRSRRGNVFGYRSESGPTCHHIGRIRYQPQHSHPMRCMNLYTTSTGRSPTTLIG